MTDFIDMTKADLAAVLKAAGIELTASQIKKTSHADLVQMAGEKARSEPTVGEIVANLTPLEKAVVVALLDAGMDCNGAETLDAMRADNMCCADVAELSTRTGLTKNQLKGVISSLSSKALISANVEKVNGQPGVDQWLDDRGIVVAFELVADGVEATAPKAAPKVKAEPKPKTERVLDDRIIVPVGKLENVKAMTDGSKRHLLAQALERGATVEHLMETLGWNRDTVTAAIRWDIAQVGLGVERKGGRYFLIKPEGLKRLPVRTKDVTRADALVAACR